jgi:hypothetical protein
MLNVQLNEESGIALLEPEGALTQSDFESAAKVIDPFIEKVGELNGIIIHVESFPGWDSFAALMTHLEFIRDHHRKVAKIAFVTDSPIGDIAESMGGFFVKAQIKEFAFGELEQANSWILKHHPE